MPRIKPESLTIALFAAVSSTAVAQQAPDQGAVNLPTINVEGAGGGDGGYSGPPVLQSTTKLDVPTFNLPVSVQTVPKQVIQDQDAILLQDAIQNVSGVRSNSNNLEGYVFNIRGFQTQNVFRNGLLVGVAIPQAYDTANLQSIEVFKGPASYLFGRADPGGVINRVTKRPLDAPYGSFTEQFGSFNLWRQVWDLTGPVKLPVLADDALAYRFAGAYTNNGEFVDFIQNKFLFLAPSVAWKIGPDTTLVVDAEYTNQNAQSNVGQPAISNNPAINTDPFSVLRPNLYPANIPAYRSLGEPNQPPDRVRSALIAYELTHHFDDNWKLTNRFLAARATLEKLNLTGNGFFDPDNPFLLDRSIGYQKITGTNYSANLDLTGHFDVLGARNDILIGTDYFYSYYNYILSISGSYPINIFQPMYGGVPTSDFYSAGTSAWDGTTGLNGGFTSFSSVAEKDLGLYVQDSITLFDNLHVLLGGRYDLADVRSGRDNNFSNPTGIASFGQAYANFGTNPVEHNQKFSPRIGVNYQPVPWLAFYGSYTKSFGLPNGLSINNIPLPPELSQGWEGGVKAELFDRRLLATLAFFQITKSNLITPANPLDPASDVVPTGLARSRGVEVDILGKLTDELNVIASYAHIDARFLSDVFIFPTDTGINLKGNSLGIYAPDSGSVWLTYAFPKDSGLEGWTAGGGVFAASNRWGDDANTFILPAYARLDAMARYQFVAGGAKWSAQINLNNIADTRYYPANDTFFNNIGRLGVFPGAPRNIRVSLRAEF